MKAILVLDEMPQDCVCCPCYRQAKYEYLEDCAKALRPLTPEERDNRPSWCPLLEINDNIAKLIEVAR